MPKFLFPIVLAPTALLAGCVTTANSTPNRQTAQSYSSACDEQRAAKIGRFDLALDLLLANFDSKPDVDDLHAVAALGTMLKDPALACVQYLAIAGAYGTQGGEFIQAPELFNLAFGNRWRDAHADHHGTLSAAAASVRQTLNAGGDIWIAEAGQSDFSAALIQALADTGMDNETMQRIHLIQHSEWNENAASPGALEMVRSRLDYRRIPDGNASANGSPGFNTPDGTWWPAVLADAEIGPLWTEAKRLSDMHNGVAGYLNPNIDAGGFDFSDTSEAAYIFGFEDLSDTDAFFRHFGGKRMKSAGSRGR